MAVTEGPTETLRRRFTELAPSTRIATPQDLAALRDAVCAFVDASRDDGVLPEHVIVTIKSLALETGVSMLGTPLFDQMIRWCIAHYFRVPAPEPTR